MSRLRLYDGLAAYHAEEAAAFEGENSMTDAPSLAGFTLAHLEPFVRQGGSLPDPGEDVRYMHAGIDDIRGAVIYLISRARHSLKITMYGYDDDKINEAVLAKMRDPSVFVQVTLDKSQAGGAHEKKLLDYDRAQLGPDFKTKFAIGQSETHQILHTKGFVVDGVVMVEGSVNWSDSGEGAFVAGHTDAGGVGFKAQANTMSICTAGGQIGRFTGVLDHQHQVAEAQMAKATA